MCIKQCYYCSVKFWWEIWWIPTDECSVTKFLTSPFKKFQISFYSDMNLIRKVWTNHLWNFYPSKFYTAWYVIYYCIAQTFNSRKLLYLNVSYMKPTIKPTINLSKFLLVKISCGSQSSKFYPIKLLSDALVRSWTW